jgi:hypothetical protein
LLGVAVAISGTLKAGDIAVQQPVELREALISRLKAGLTVHQEALVAET